MNNIPHSDGLYPDWDEFYLAVCDICDMIIKPQALEKHLASKHGINVLKSLPLQNGHNQNNHNQNHPITTNNSNHNHTNSKSKPSVSLAQTEVPAPTLDSNTAVPNHIATQSNNTNNNTPVANTNGLSNTSKTTTNTNTVEKEEQDTKSATPSSSSKCWGGKQSLDSSPKPANGRQPCYLMRMRYRGTKWRNTYDVLKDVLF